MPIFRYHLYGLELSSELELPELMLSRGEQPDVEIRVVERLGALGSRLDIAGIADFRVENGQRIDIALHPGASLTNVRLFLLGSAMGLLLHQRGDLALHANALALGTGAVMVMGASAAGKSSLAAWMQRCDIEPLSDDVCVVRLGENATPTLYAGVPRLRLWEDALERQALNADALCPVYEGDPDYRKFSVPLRHEAAGSGARELKAAYVLEQDETFGITRFSTLDAVEALFAHTYRGEYVVSDGDPLRHWRDCVSLASSLPVFAVRRTMDLARIDEENARLLDHMSPLLGVTRSD